MRTCMGLAMALTAGCALLVASAHGQAAEPSAASGSSAATGDDDPPGYREAVEQALAEYQAQNFAEARALFGRAHELRPNARTLRGLGMMEFELKNYAASIARLEAALASQAKPLQGELRAHSERLLARAKAFVGRYTLALTPAPRAVLVQVDGVPVELSPERTLTLTVGEHVLHVQADGYRDEKRALSVKGGEQRTLAIALQLIRSAPALATSTSRDGSPSNDDRSLWSSPWLWTGVGAIVVGSVVATLLITSGGDDHEPQRGDIGGVVMTLRRSR